MAEKLPNVPRALYAYPLIVRVLDLHRELFAFAVDDRLGDVIRSARDRRILRGNLYGVARVVQV